MVQRSQRIYQFHSLAQRDDMQWTNYTARLNSLALVLVDLLILIKSTLSQSVCLCSVGQYSAADIINLCLMIKIIINHTYQVADWALTHQPDDPKQCTQTKLNQNKNNRNRGRFTSIQIRKVLDWELERLQLATSPICIY